MGKQKKILVDNESEIKEIENQPEEMNNISSVESSSNNSKIYFGFSTRLIFYIVLFVVFSSVSSIFFIKSIKLEAEKNVTISEKSNINYKVFLKKNDFYDTPYLEKNMSYIASLIDKIELNYNYNLVSSQKENIDFSYDVVADLLIVNKLDSKSYFEKKYVLVDNKTVSMNNDTTKEINQVVDIDYKKYNDIANSFRMSYGVDAESKLVVHMNVHKQNSKGENFELNDLSTMDIEIPLSEKTVNISLNYKDLNQSKKILARKSIAISNVPNLIIGIVLFVLAILSFYKIIKMLFLLSTKKTAYDRYVEKILKEYDRLIAEVSTLIPFEDKEIVKIKKFTELVDIHDNLGLPIIHYTITKHSKCYFYIHHKGTVYLLTVKAVDLDEKKENN